MINATSYTNRNASESAGNDDDFARYSGYAPPGASDERGAEDPRYSGYAAPATSGSLGTFGCEVEQARFVDRVPTLR